MAAQPVIDPFNKDELVTALAQLFSVDGNADNIFNIFDPTMLLGGLAGLLTVLKGALSAPLVTLYQISAEVVVMVALIMFISYVGSLIGVDVFGLVDDGFFTGSTGADFTGFTGFTARRDEQQESSYSTDYFNKRSAESPSFWNSAAMQKLTSRVWEAFEKYSQ